MLVVDDNYFRSVNMDTSPGASLLGRKKERESRLNYCVSGFAGLCLILQVGIPKLAKGFRGPLRPCLFQLQTGLRVLVAMLIYQGALLEHCNKNKHGM